MYTTAEEDDCLDGRDIKFGMNGFYIHLRPQDAP